MAHGAKMHELCKWTRKPRIPTVFTCKMILGMILKFKQNSFDRKIVKTIISFCFHKASQKKEVNSDSVLI